MDTGVLDRRHERVDLTVGGDRFGEGPPELDAFEAGGHGGGRPLEQWQLGEEDRAVDLVAQ